MTPPVPSLAGERALAELGWVRRLAQSLVRDPGLAEDVVQEAWLLALERPPRATSTSGLRAWLAQVTRTLVRSRLRGEQARRLREELCSRHEAGEPAASEVVERTQQEQRVVAALMALEEPYRSAVLWRHVDGLSARAIAARQGTSVANARQRVARGLALLRRALDREHGGDGRTWVLALVPSLRQSGPVTAAAALLGGPALVKTTTTLLAALAATVLGALLLRGALVREPAPQANPAESKLGVALAAVPEPERADAPVLPGAADARVPVVTAAPAPVAPPLRVHARLLDVHGKPLPGAELAQPGGAAGARAGAGGAVELVLAEPAFVNDESGERLLTFVARAAHCRDALRYEPAPRGDVLELGELRLYPIGALGGSVRDAAGNPLAGAEVHLALPGVVDALRTRLHGPEYSLQERRERADEGGRFLYEEVPAGVWCLWAGAPGFAWTRTEPLRVEPAEGVRELELVLEPLLEDELIRGRVRAENGEALAGIEILATRAETHEVDGWATSDGQGRFVLAAERGARHRLRAEEPDGQKERRFGTALVDDLLSGAGEVLLVLPEARWLDIVVVQQGGAALRGALVREEHGSPTGDGFFSLADKGPHAGRAHVLVPEVPFTLHVLAEGFTPAELGPFDPLAAPAELRVELVPLAHVRGVVRAGGEPVANALVQLVQLSRPGSVYYLYGFPARLDGQDLQGTTTDDEGRFELAIPFRTTCALYAEKEGFAASERSPLTLDPAREERIDLELGPGGAVEGRVLVPAGESPAGILVRLCRGDMRTHEAVTDEEGRYRLEHLTPGPFMVLAERKRAGRAFGFAAAAIEPVEREDFEFPWALEVRAGETTRYDVDLAAQERASIAGTLRIDAKPPGAATLRLVKPEEVPWPRRFNAEQQALEADGSFAVEERRRENLVLVFEIGAGSLAGTTIARTLELERGVNRVEVELASASLRGTLPAGESGPFALVTELGPGLVGVTPIPAGVGGFALGGVPASAQARLVAWRPGAEREDPRTWSELARCALAAGRWNVVGSE
jgi:RNA polymerase sigma-70 factor (ECF subfamily)